MVVANDSLISLKTFSFPWRYIWKCSFSIQDFKPTNNSKSTYMFFFISIVFFFGYFNPAGGAATAKNFTGHANISNSYKDSKWTTPNQSDGSADF